jgi:hypothetical protein
MNSAVPWLAVLRLGASEPASSATLKILYSLMNTGQTLLPLSSSAVVAATIGQSPITRRTTVGRLWSIAVAFSVVMSATLLVARNFVAQVYGTDYPGLLALLPLAAAGVVGCTIYWIFWPVQGTSSAGGADNARLSALVFVTVLLMLLFGTSTQACLTIYTAAITVGGFIITLRLDSSLRVVAVAVFPIATYFVGR